MNKKRSINKTVKRYISNGIRYYRRFNAKGYEKAIEKFSKAIELDLNNASAYKYRGDVNMIINPDQGIKDFTKAIELKPNYVSAYKSRAILYEYSYENKHNEAIADFSTILKYAPNHFEAYLYLGQIFSDLKEYDSSILDFTKAIELKPKSFRVYILRGQDYIQIRQDDKAIEDFTTAVNSDKWYEKADGYIELGETYCLLKDYNKAINCYTKAIKIFEGTKNPYLEKCYKKRSEAYLFLGEKEKADTDLNLAYEVELGSQKQSATILF